MSDSAFSKDGSADSGTDAASAGEHGRHEAVEDGVSGAEQPGYSPSERNLQASLSGDHYHQGDHLSADRPTVPEDERQEPAHRVEAPRYPGPLPGETTAEFEGRTERSAGDPIPDSAQSSALHAAMITGEAQAGHRYPHSRP